MPKHFLIQSQFQYTYKCMTENKCKNYSFIARTLLICARPNGDDFRAEMFPFFKIRDYTFGDEFTGSLKKKKIHKNVSL